MAGEGLIPALSSAIVAAGPEDSSRDAPLLPGQHHQRAPVPDRFQTGSGRAGDKGLTPYAHTGSGHAHQSA